MSGSSPTTGTITKNRATAMVARFLVLSQSFRAILQRSKIERIEPIKIIKIKNQA